MKGIILAGGKGTRLYPMTLVTSKQLLPIYDKPMIYYPISTLMLGGIRDILIISTPQDLPRFEDLLGDGSRLGINLSYAEQANPSGIPEAFLIGEEFIAGDNVCLILGDNLFHGDISFLRSALKRDAGGTVFGYPVHDPERYGVVEFDNHGNVISMEEKPKHPKSRYAITGLYCYDNTVIEISRNLKPSGRGETEITDVSKQYLADKKLHVELLSRGIAWLDTGTPQSLLDAASFVANIEHRQGMKIGCIEESAFEMNYIDIEQLRALAKDLSKSEYGRYLIDLVEMHANQ
jgi:glucose-1-phosphate thymidylyltransferase